jgi:hypothetical protein
MDFHYWKKTGNDAFKAQKNFIDAHPDSFEHIADPFGSVALFRYVEALDFDTIRSPTKPPIWRRVVKKSARRGNEFKAQAVRSQSIPGSAVKQARAEP